MVFSPKYRGKVLVGDVAMVAEAIIRKICKEPDNEIIDMAVISLTDSKKMDDKPFTFNVHVRENLMNWAFNY